MSGPAWKFGSNCTQELFMAVLGGKLIKVLSEYKPCLVSLGSMAVSLFYDHPWGRENALFCLKVKVQLQAK